MWSGPPDVTFSRGMHDELDGRELRNKYHSLTLFPASDFLSMLPLADPNQKKENSRTQFIKVSLPGNSSMQRRVEHESLEASGKDQTQ